MVDVQQNDKQRRLADRLLAQLKGTLAEAVILHSVTGHIHYVSHNAALLFDANFVVGNNLLTNIDAQHEQTLRQTILSLAATDNPTGGETVIVQLQGSSDQPRWIRLCISCVRDKQGAVLEFHTAISDVSGYMQVIGDVGLFEDISRVTQEMAMVGGWTFNPNTRQLIFSEQLRKIYELSSTDVVTPEMSSELIGQTATQKIRDAIAATLQGTGSQIIDIQATGKKGQALFLRMYVAADRSDPNEVIIYGATKDITEHVLRQQELELAVQRLVANRNRLEEFGEIVSYQLQTVVAKLSGLTSMLTKQSSPDEFDELLTAVQETVTTLGLTVHETTDIMKVHLSDAPPYSRLYISDALVRVKARLSSRIREISVAIETTHDANTAVYYPNEYLDTVLRQLLTACMCCGNDRTSPTIKIDVAQCGDHAVIVLQASGLDIQPDAIRRGLAKTPQPGDAVNVTCSSGLFTIKTLLESTGGSLEFRYNVGDTAEFVIDLGPGTMTPPVSERYGEKKRWMGSVHNASS